MKKLIVLFTGRHEMRTYLATSILLTLISASALAGNCRTPLMKLRDIVKSRIDEANVPPSRKLQVDIDKIVAQLRRYSYPLAASALDLLFEPGFEYTFSNKGTPLYAGRGQSFTLTLNNIALLLKDAGQLQPREAVGLFSELVEVSSFISTENSKLFMQLAQISLTHQVGAETLEELVVQITSLKFVTIGRVLHQMNINERHALALIDEMLEQGISIIGIRNKINAYKSLDKEMRPTSNNEFTWYFVGYRSSGGGADD